MLEKNNKKNTHIIIDEQEDDNADPGGDLDDVPDEDENPSEAPQPDLAKPKRRKTTHKPTRQAAAANMPIISNSPPRVNKMEGTRKKRTPKHDDAELALYAGIQQSLSDLSKPADPLSPNALYCSALCADLDRIDDNKTLILLKRKLSNSVSDAQLLLEEKRAAADLMSAQAGQNMQHMMQGQHVPTSTAHLGQLGNSTASSSGGHTYGSPAAWTFPGGPGATTVTLAEPGSYMANL